MEQIKKPKSARTRRILKHRESKTVEDVKQALLICGHRGSSIGKSALSNLGRLKYLESVILANRHIGLAPFENGGELELERLGRLKNCALFVVANHTKSKPNNLVFGRLFDHQLYDLIELGIQSFTPITSFAKSCSSSYPLGAKPCIVFLGNGFASNPALRQLKEVFLDFFRGEEVNGIVVEGLKRLIVITADSEKVIRFRQYCIDPKSHIDGTATVDDFNEVGPRFDFVLRRFRDAPNELKTVAFARPSSAKKEKNVGKDTLENKVGAVYVPSQDVDKIITARPKGTKRQRREKKAERQIQKRSKLPKVL
eukprot:g6077.t1